MVNPLWNENVGVEVNLAASLVRLVARISLKGPTGNPSMFSPEDAEVLQAVRIMKSTGKIAKYDQLLLNHVYAN